MLVTAQCIKEVFDCGLVENGRIVREPRYYYRGPVPNFDTELEVLANQTTDSGFWCFQWPGHEGRAPGKGPKRYVPPVPPAEEPKVEAKPKGRPMTAEQKAKMAAGREAAKASRLAAASV